MGRKPKAEKQTITVVVNGTVIPVILHPPKPPRQTWYAYWPGLTASKSTGQMDFAQAALAAENMVRNGGKRGDLTDAVLSDEEFEAIQRAHFTRKQDPGARIRAEKSLVLCLEAIAAFKGITGIEPITLANPDDCAAFQRKALRLPKSWRLKYRNAKRKGAACYSPQTVLRWSRSLQAAFERASINGGKKCVRGIVDNAKLLTINPWRAFTWIEGTTKPIRQFSPEELVSILDYFDDKWQGVSVATAAAKGFLWLWCRLSELASLKWDDLRIVGDEYQFRESLGRWASRSGRGFPRGCIGRCWPSELQPVCVCRLQLPDTPELRATGAQVICGKRWGQIQPGRLRRLVSVSNPRMVQGYRAPARNAACVPKNRLAARPAWRGLEPVGRPRCKSDHFSDDAALRQRACGRTASRQQPDLYPDSRQSAA